MPSNSTCQCGHPLGEHLLVKGFECSPGVTIDGQTSLPDVWVCSGGRLADVTREDFSPWDLVCGCVLHDDPSPQSLVAVDSAAQIAPAARQRSGAGTKESGS